MMGEGEVRGGSGEARSDGRLQERIFATSGLIFINKVMNVGEKDAYHGLGVERAENEGCGRRAKHADPPNARLRQA